ncbi:hypothetical protein FKM82_025356 [Ascaphus truei]
MACLLGAHLPYYHQTGSPSRFLFRASSPSSLSKGSNCVVARVGPYKAAVEGAHPGSPNTEVRPNRKSDPTSTITIWVGYRHQVRARCTGWAPLEGRGKLFFPPVPGSTDE